MRIIFTKPKSLQQVWNLQSLDLSMSLAVMQIQLHQRRYSATFFRSVQFDMRYSHFVVQCLWSCLAWCSTRVKYVCWKCAVADDEEADGPQTETIVTFAWSWLSKVCNNCTGCVKWYISCRCNLVLGVLSAQIQYCRRPFYLMLLEC